jgi:hypothetical protein
MMEKLKKLSTASGWKNCGNWLLLHDGKTEETIYCFRMEKLWKLATAS